MDEKTIQRIKKLQALAERGVGGEKTTAQKKLAKLLKDNGINSLDELQKEEYEYTIFSYNGKHEITAINNFATHCSKLKPEIEGSALKSLEKTLQHKPNYFMDTTKFIKRLATYVAVEHTAFIIPIEDEYGRLCGWYPLRAERCEVVESEGQLYLRYLFANGSYAYQQHQ